jgi:hypothetical protein
VEQLAEALKMKKQVVLDLKEQHKSSYTYVMAYRWE